MKKYRGKSNILIKLESIQITENNDPIQYIFFLCQASYFMDPHYYLSELLRFNTGSSVKGFTQQKQGSLCF